LIFQSQKHYCHNKDTVYLELYYDCHNQCLSWLQPQLGHKHSSILISNILNFLLWFQASSTNRLWCITNSHFLLLEKNNIKYNSQITPSGKMFLLNLKNFWHDLKLHANDLNIFLVFIICTLPLQKIFYFRETQYDIALHY